MFGQKTVTLKLTDKEVRLLHFVILNAQITLNEGTDNKEIKEFASELLYRISHH